MKKVLFLSVLLFSGLAAIAQTLSLPLDSTRANPFNRMRDLVGTNDVAMVYDADNGNGQRILHALFRMNGEPGNQPFVQTAQFEAVLGDVIEEPRRIMTASGDVNGDGREELIYGFSSVFNTARIRVAFVDPQTQQITQSPHASIGPMITMDGNIAQSESAEVPTYFGKFELYVLDLDGNGADEVVVAYFNAISDQLRVDVYRWNGTELYPSGMLLSNVLISLECGLNGYDTQESWGIAFDDFDYDKRPEMVMAAHQGTWLTNTFLRVYDINISDPNNFAFVEKAYFNVGNYCEPITEVLTGDFNGDLVPEVALSTLSGAALAARIFRVGDNEGVGADDYLELVQSVSLGGVSPSGLDVQYSTNAYENFFDVPWGLNQLPDMVRYSDAKVGDFNRDGRDDIAFCSPWAVQVIHGNANFILMNYWSGSGDVYITPDLVVPAPSVFDFVQLTDLNLDGFPEVVAAHNVFTDTEQQELRLSYFVRNSSGDGEEVNQIAVSSNVFDSDASFASATSFSLASGDFGGDGYELGDPVQYTLNEIVQPIIRLGAPPVHSDDVGGEFVNVTGCFAGDCPFTTQYEVVNETTITVSNEIHSDWSVGASVGGGVDIGVASVSAKVEATYGEGFSNAATTSETHTEIVQVSTSFDDYVYVSIVNYDVREYPVYQGGELKTYMVSMRPTDIDHDWRASKSPDMQLYLPVHEPGNILSYPNPDREEDVLAGLGAGLIGSSNYGVGAGQSYTWTVGYSEMAENSSNLSRDMSINASLNASAYGVEVGITGAYSVGSISTHSSQVQQSISCIVDHQSFSASVADAPYSMRPYMSWGADGSLLVDYLVEPQEPSFGTENYWSLNYGIQDPAWNLPWRLDAAREFAIDDDSKTRLSKSFWMTDYHDGHQVIYPHPGDTVVVHARVFNYSLEDTEGAVPVSFFVGHPMAGGLQLTDLDGNSIVYTDSFIPAQWYKEVNFAVVLPSYDEAPDARLYGVIDPQQQWEEVHEINNYGWVALGPYFPLVQNEVISVEEMTNQANDIFRMWPNPAQEQVFIQAEGNGRMEVQLTDLSGRSIRRTIIQGGARQTISVADLAPGIYMVTLHQGDRNWSQRLVVE